MLRFFARSHSSTCPWPRRTTPYTWNRSAVDASRVSTGLVPSESRHRATCVWCPEENVASFFSSFFEAKAKARGFACARDRPIRDTRLRSNGEDTSSESLFFEVVACSFSQTKRRRTQGRETCARLCSGSHRLDDDDELEISQEWCGGALLCQEGARGGSESVSSKSRR